MLVSPQERNISVPNQVHLHDFAQCDQHVKREDWIAASAEKAAPLPECTEVSAVQASMHVMMKMNNQFKYTAINSNHS